MGEEPTDFQCPICGTFYVTADGLLQHFLKDFDSEDGKIELCKWLVKITYNVSKYGDWRKCVTDSKSFDHISYYSKYPDKEIIIKEGIK